MEDILKEILKEIKKHTSPKFSDQFVVSSTKTSFITTFDPPLDLDKDKHYEIALVNLETYYSFPNISKDNNMFEYSKDNGRTWLKIFIPEGAYEIKSLNTKIQSMIGGDDIKLEPNRQTLKSIMTIKPGYTVSFKEKNTLANLLGFYNEIYEAGTHESEHIVNILSVNSILIRLNIINGSVVNGSRTPVIYSFFPNVSPGYKIVEKPQNLVYLPISQETITDLKVEIIDQNEKPLNLRGETVTIRFHIREI